ncbi:MAG TPA: SDR family NAD(P)-dependent oxidoreductase, partial [Trichormus sp.]
MDFAEQLMAATSGQGVDVVLNSLAGDFIPASLSTVKTGGRFVELGKRDIWPDDKVAREHSTLSYKALALDHLFKYNPAQVVPYLRTLCDWCEQGDMAPVKVTSFPLERAPEAFDYIRQAKHIGKVVLTPTSAKAEQKFRSDGTYIITGGLGGLGLELSAWLVEHGARNIALLGRREPSDSARKRIGLWQRQGATVRTYAVDVGDRGALTQTLNAIRQTMPSVRGVFHAAGALSDGVLMNQTWQNFQEVFVAKVHGTWHLHELTMNDPLDHFVLFSSAVSMVGSAGQSNHAAANAFLDGLAHYRANIGLPCVSINWGAWSSVGKAAEALDQGNGLRAGIKVISPQRALEALDAVLDRPDAVQVGIVAMNWEAYFTEFDCDQPLLSEIQSALRSQGRAVPAQQHAVSTIVAQIHTSEVNDRLGILQQYVENQVRAVLQWRDYETLNRKQGFFELGIDSLMSVELANRLKRDLDKYATISAPIIFDHPTVERLTQYLAEQLQLAAPKVVAAAQFVPAGSKEAIAIVGMGCRFPGGANNPDQFWQNLANGIDGVSLVPKERWDIEHYYDQDSQAPGKMYVREGGFLNVPVDVFDNKFFGISPREAEWMDPQHRLLLEVTWEALENANIDPTTLQGTLTGVFIGIGSNDYGQLIAKHGQLDDISAYRATGNSSSIAAGRLAYSLGAQGPCLAIDTACSSSLVAVHNACTSLLNGESDCAIAGGVNLILAPESTITLCKANMLSVDERCKTFDASADGFIRSEGCGVVVLKRLSDAVDAGDHILAVIRGGCVNQDGASSGLTVPNGVAQERLILTALRNAQLQADDIDLVEAHGTGTSLGDPIEVSALREVFGETRSQEHPLIVGSVKTNIGHVEAASGIAGLIKVVLSLQNESIPQHLHLKQINPMVALDEIPAVLPTSSLSWARQPDHIRRAGVSSFGFGGTNAHVILEEAPALAETHNLVDRSLHLLTLSAKTVDALDQQIDRYSSYIAEHPEHHLADLAYSANVGRAHFGHRLAVVAEDATELVSGLINRKYIEGVTSLGQAKPKVAFVFTGHGSLNPGTGRELYETQPIFKASIDRCSQLFASHYQEQTLVEALYGGETLFSHHIYGKAYGQAAVFAVQVSLAELWKSFGVTADVLIGDGLGDHALSVVDGTTTLEAALTSIISEAQQSKHAPSGGELTASCRQSIAKAVADGCQIFIAIGTEAQHFGLEVECAHGDQALCIPSLRHGQNDWRVLLESMAQLYVRGIDIDWVGFDKPYHRNKIHLPTYPFQRTRHWLFNSEDSVDRMLPAFDSRTLRAQIDSLSQDANVAKLSSEFRILQSEFESLSLGYICQSLQQLGFSPKVGDTFTGQSLFDQLRIIDQHRRMVAHCLNKLAAHRILENGPQGWRVLNWPTTDDLQLRHSQLLERYPSFSIELCLLHRSGAKLAQLWRGEEDALSLLFGPAGEISIKDLYFKSPIALVFNEVLKRSVQTLIAQLPDDRPLRVLEIGAGTGGSTNLLLPHFSAEKTEYVFTDLSKVFLDEASQRFRPYPFVRYQLLDIEVDPNQQGLAPGQFDIVIAANVLHATRDLRETVQNVRQLMAPGGLLFLMEGMAEQLWLDLTFGALDGWWRFTEDELRRDYLLLSGAKWQSLLMQEGFGQVDVFSAWKDCPQATIIGQATTEPALIPLPDKHVAIDRTTRHTANTAQRTNNLLKALQPNSVDGALRQIENSDVSERFKHLTNYIDQQVRGVLRWPDNETLDQTQGFFDLGMDSLMAVELSNHLRSDL